MISWLRILRSSFLALSSSRTLNTAHITPNTRRQAPRLASVLSAEADLKSEFCDRKATVQNDRSFVPGV